MPAAGSLSVVVCAHSRPRRLAACLAAVRDQRGVELEVIVVADGATPAVLRMLEGAGPSAGGSAGPRVIRLDPGRGPAAARNAGWRAATAEFVAFTDDDCVPAPGWAAALLATAGPAGRIVQGSVGPLEAERDRVGPFTRSLWVADVGPFFQTANILYPRALLERLGGFDERFPAPAGEDTDLGWRALEAGATAMFAPEARVGHAVHEPGWRGLVSDAARWGGAVRLIKRHPGLRAHFHRQYFWKPAHAALCLAAASGGVAVLWSPLRAAGSPRRFRGATPALAAAFVTGGRWALVHRREHPSRGSLLRSLPAHLAVDAAEIAALARGSLRERTLFL